MSFQDYYKYLINRLVEEGIISKIVKEKIYDKLTIKRHTDTPLPYRTKFIHPDYQNFHMYYDWTPLISYCGGASIGNVFAHNFSMFFANLNNEEFAQFKKSYAGTMAFIMSLVETILQYRSYVILTNNHSQNAWCSKIRKLLEKHSDINMQVSEMRNANTNNEIYKTELEFYNISRSVKQTMYDRSTQDTLIKEFLDKFVILLKNNKNATNPSAKERLEKPEEITHFFAAESR